MAGPATHSDASARSADQPQAQPWRLLPGTAHRLGAVVVPGGVNFALAAPHASRVELCLFSDDASQETARLDLPCQTDGVWHGWLAQAQPGLLYGYRVHGPWAPAQGHRFNPAKLLLDPCARAVLGRYDGDAIHLGHRADDPSQPDLRDNAAQALKAQVVADLPAATPLDEQRAAPPGTPAGPRVIYELHVKGFSALQLQIPPQLRGTYAGLVHPAALAHLKALGVTTLSIMPIALRADEMRLQQLGLSNYWGYSPIAWNAPETRYWSGTPGSTPRSELRAMVDALHAAGLEVVLDVVYNHTGETDEFGPTLSLRGIDNATYYQLEPGDPARYLNWTGCGNCVNLNQPLVLRTVMDSLRNWVTEFGVDGFRFDLAPVLARGDAATQYRYAASAPLLMAIAQDPLLQRRLMIAEPWDIGPGGYQMGQFPSGWLEWNDQFRDVQRSFWLQGGESLGTLAQRLAGSADRFDARRRSAASSVNFVTSHDGFTLTDLVSYQQRHNEANGEHNRDGHGHNLSVNHGVEGPSSDPDVNARRQRQRRTLLAATLLSLGTPMLLGGDEIGHTQQGNNNAYCQDNAITWLNWDQADAALSAFVARVIRVRRERQALHSVGWWQPAQGTPAGHGTGCASTACWWRADGQAMDAADWQGAHARALALELRSGPPSAQASHADRAQAAPVAEAAEMTSTTAAAASCLLLINGSDQPVCFTLPPGHWLRHLDSASGDCTDVSLPAQVKVPPGCLWLASQAPLLA